MRTKTKSKVVKSKSASKKVATKLTTKRSVKKFSKGGPKNDPPIKTSGMSRSEALKDMQNVKFPFISSSGSVYADEKSLRSGCPSSNPNVCKSLESSSTKSVTPIKKRTGNTIVMPYGRSYFNEGKSKGLQGGKQTYARFEKVTDPNTGKVRYLPKSGKSVEFTTLMDPTFKRGGKFKAKPTAKKSMTVVKKSKTVSRKRK